MKTFQIRNGDLVVGPGGFTTITGAPKVKQDMAVAVREPYGSDRFHPRWGSLLSTYVGQPMSDDMQMRVTSEITRVVANYMAVQQDQMTAAAAKGQRSRYGTGEVVADIRNIAVRQTYDRLHIKVTLATVAGDTVTLTSSVGL